MTINEKLSALRAAMHENGIAAYIIPSSDPHQSEYVSDYWKSRQWISGFTGSAGTFVITSEHAGLWTDSRYFIQAEEQLSNSDVMLHKLNIPHAPEHIEWMMQTLPEKSKVGLDGRIFSVGAIRRMAKSFYKKSIDLETGLDLIQRIWLDRPLPPQEPVFEHPVKYCGQSRIEKIQALRDKMGEADYYLISTLDDIAWLFNLRGADVPCNPVFYSFAIISTEQVFLFIEPSKAPNEIKDILNAIGVILKEYEGIEEFLKSLPEKKKIHIDLASINNQLFNAISKESIAEGQNLVAPLKAIKNEVEIAHIRNAMRKDGVALVRLFRWLEQTVNERSVSEAEAASKIAAFRREQADYFGESFDAIVGYEANGAIVHYKPEEGSCAIIQRKGMLLFDSGGQYIDGTTDITRTVLLGHASDEQKTDFTLVLKGHLALTNAVFPAGTTGVQLDTLARSFLWQHQLNYGHGTGHGVGFFNNVHEGPQGFSPVPNTPRSTTEFVPGMLTSNEPGIYKTDKYGIRIENLILCVEDGESDFGKFYKFETLSLFPYDSSLLKMDILTTAEIQLINRYHEEVYKSLSTMLNKEEKTWLLEKCKPI